ncbi:type II toxin-antitoxin system VapC family toxin [Fibrella sp. WM1]|uniref:type II toxin-antitoxin system VapC family toxin n=1 Tax=Fibrella musci TaxID=3242485 RepID=UPI003520FCFF
MNGNRLLLDSNIVIYLSKKSLLVSDFSFPNDELLVSLITYMEVVGYPFVDANEEAFTKSLFSLLAPLPITQAIAERVVGYRKIRKIKLPDAIILATAREHGCQLITRNVSDFAGLDDQVSILNPFDKPTITT